jgi:hypothetical protein
VRLSEWCRRDCTVPGRSLTLSPAPRHRRGSGSIFLCLLSTRHLDQREHRPLHGTFPSDYLLARGHTRATRGSYANHLTRLRETVPKRVPALDRAAVKISDHPTSADARGSAIFLKPVRDNCRVTQDIRLRRRPGIPDKRITSRRQAQPPRARTSLTPFHDRRGLLLRGDRTAQPYGIVQVEKYIVHERAVSQELFSPGVR